MWFERSLLKISRAAKRRNLNVLNEAKVQTDYQKEGLACFGYTIQRETNTGAYGENWNNLWKEQGTRSYQNLFSSSETKQTEYVVC